MLKQELAPRGVGIPVLQGGEEVKAKDCRYTHTELGQADARCGGCKHRVTKGEPC